jgi:hypothetical protein
MSDEVFHLNRPVHLARRDLFYEQAKKLIKTLPAQKKTDTQQEAAEKALGFFCEAKKHAEAANRSGKASAEDRLFMEFLDTAADDVQSITLMLRRQQSAESEDCPLGRFLESADVSQKMAVHYRRCAAHILKGLLLVLQNADQPYEQLRNTTLAKMGATDKARYDKAREHLSQILGS